MVWGKEDKKKVTPAKKVDTKPATEVKPVVSKEEKEQDNSLLKETIEEADIEKDEEETDAYETLMDKVDIKDVIKEAEKPAEPQKTVDVLAPIPATPTVSKREEIRAKNSDGLKKYRFIFNPPEGKMTISFGKGRKEEVRYGTILNLNQADYNRFRNWFVEFKEK